MRTAGRFVEHFSCLIYPLGLARYLRDDVSFKHVRQNETGMMVHLTNASRRIGNLTDRDLPVVQGEIGELVYKDRTTTAFARLILSAGGGLRKQS